MIRLGLIADTHLPTRAKALPDQVFRAFGRVDGILHAGDLCTREVLTLLEAVAPVDAVCGNMDPWDVAQVAPERREYDFDGVKVGLTHGHLGRGRTTPQCAASWFPDARVVVFGHSHLPLIEERDGQLLVNPGSPTDPRRAPTPSCAILTIEGGEARAELVRW